MFSVPEAAADTDPNLLYSLKTQYAKGVAFELIGFGDMQYTKNIALLSAILTFVCGGTHINVPIARVIQKDI